jgi:hypothetical protein
VRFCAASNTKNTIATMVETSNTFQDYSRLSR